MTFTWQDYLQLPEQPLRHEVLAGELVVSPAPSVRHQQVLKRLARQLQERIEDPGLGQVLIAPLDVRLSQVDVVQPDLMVVLQANLHRLGPQFLDGPPDLAIEVISPGTARRDRGLKRRRYEALGVREYWIVDPEAGTVEQFAHNGDALRRAGEHRTSIACHVAPGVTIDLLRVF